jgi:hypothetical protein
MKSRGLTQLARIKGQIKEHLHAQKLEARKDTPAAQRRIERAEAKRIRRRNRRR